MRITLVLATVSLGSLAGCSWGSGTSSTPEHDKVKVTSTDELKDRLKFVSESGTAGSALAGMKEMIEKVDDSAKREKLQKDYDRIQHAGNPAEVKKIANEMLELL